MTVFSLVVPAPIRRAASRGTLERYSGFSPKLGRQVNFSTRAEYLHWLLLEGTPAIVQFCEYYPQVNLESWKFVFDMWIRWRDGHEECRQVISNWHYDGLVDFAPKPEEWNLLCSWGREHGYACSMVTERGLAPRMRCIQNWQRLLPFVAHFMQNPDEDLEHMLLQRLTAAELPLRELTRRQQPPRATQVTAAVAKLLHAGMIAGDLDHCHFGPDLLLKRAD